MQVAKDKVVSIEYTLTGPDGAVLDSSDGREPLAYLHGHGNIIPGLEAALVGKSAGESLTVTVPAEQGYGKRDPQLIQAVPRDRFQGATEIKPGMQFQAQTGGGPRMVTVVKVTDQEVTVDANHPLADTALTFAVKVVEIRDASTQEIQHGHAHGAGGHHH